ncbi:HAD-superfamily phosphatase, subfamily IIIC/FkbH-like domain-containing protein [Pseudobutyrivibrio sp. NOR37]|uniref:HAD-IIIC family phosphatase n=1 Tax=Pseudobutyrivibrio xylanivorans TaxID=185007 RepID=A0A6M0LJE8_PSEXY|nr:MULTISPECIES: HAD-IIIC family phosphatase [Pseudobutyrivibrio]NEX02280.1 HAD-IIIC family phosphatase [Pseudobutyrivibrio xylanivorans]SFR77690.1 HAD-superfamily phosphatase, subfamily IIIC/FkbH-like domain-containing protein [Pseudobutyrivibrio sp. NOR37]
MDCFNYPIDVKTLRRKKASIRRTLLEQPNLIEKKIAVLGGSTTNEVVDQLELFLLSYGIKADFYQSEYGKYWEDAMFGSPELDGFEPDIIFIHTNWRNIIDFPQMNMDKTQVDDMLEAEYQRFEGMWQRLSEKFNCPIIQNNFERPNYRLMGNRDVWDYRGKANFVSRLNQKFYEYANEHTGFYINDIDYLAADFGISQWNDAKYWNMYKCINMDAITYIAQSVAFIIKSIYGRNKKVLALDLDNTLWGGIVGDDGVEGIKIGPEVPQGQVYAEFQQYCKNLKDIGAVLAVDSKNEEANALAGLNHPDGVLRPDDFVDIKANWEPKDRNLEQMASELTLGVDSFVFADDNPAEREIVSAQLPGVAVPAMDGAENYIKVLDHSGYFEVTNLSAEDMKKTDMYHAKAEASKAKAAFADYSEYLKSLDMKATITGFEPIIVQRVSQLTNKSNQFNLTTLRCSEDDIRAMEESDDYICMAGRLVDKFADNGIVTIVAGKIVGDALDISLWLMSCRVLKRGMEDLMMNQLVAEARAKGINKIVGHYYPTPKNAMVQDFFDDYGFSLTDTDDAGNKKWELNVGDYSEKVSYIENEILDREVQ